MREILSGHVHTRQRGTNMESTTAHPHLRFSNLEHYKKALEFAEQLGGEALDSFKNSFATLERICENQKATGEVHPDSVQHSFYFRIYNGDSFDFDGGIILHGLGKSFSVELAAKTGLHWSIHT